MRDSTKAEVFAAFTSIIHDEHLTHKIACIHIGSSIQDKLYTKKYAHRQYASVPGLILHSYTNDQIELRDLVDGANQIKKYPIRTE